MLLQGRLVPLALLGVISDVQRRTQPYSIKLADLEPPALALYVQRHGRVRSFSPMRFRSACAMMSLKNMVWCASPSRRAMA